MIVTTKAIVLRAGKQGDSSKILRVYTRDFGRQTLIAKGARMMKSKFGGSLEVMNIVEISFYKKPNRDLHLLSKADLILSSQKIASSFNHTIFGMMIMESIAKTQDIGAENKVLFDIISEIIEAMMKLEPNFFALFVFSQIKLAAQLGFGLDLDPLAGQQQQLIYFSIAAGSPATQKEYNSTFFTFDRATYEFLATVSRSPIDLLPHANPSKKMIVKIHNFLVKYFSFHLEKKFEYKSFSLYNSTL